MNPSDPDHYERAHLEREISKLERELSNFENELQAYSPRGLEAHQIDNLVQAIEQAEPEAARETREPGLWTRIAALGGLAAAVVLGIALTDWNSGPATPAVSASFMTDSFAAGSQPPIEGEIDASGARPLEMELLPGAQVDSESQLVDIVDEGIIILADNRQMRQLRSLFRDTITWYDPRSEATTQMIYPREETFLIPVTAL